MSILDGADGTINRKAVIEDGAKEDIERIAVIISDNYHFTRDSCFIDIDADNIEDAAIKYNSLENDFNYAVNNLNQIMELIYKGYTFQQIKDNSMIYVPIAETKEKTLAKQTEYSKTYFDKHNIKEIKLRMPEKTKEKIQEHCAETEISVNQYIMDLIKADLERIKAEQASEELEQWKEARHLKD